MGPNPEQPEHRWAWWRFLPRRVIALLPQWPFALAFLLSGGLNVLDALQHETALVARVETLSSVGRSLSVLGNTAQLILGAMLILSGLGLLWCLRSAWAFGILLVAVTAGVNLARGLIGINSILPSLMLVGLLAGRKSFDRRTPVANYALSLLGVLAVLAYGTFGAYLFGTGFRPSIRDLPTAFYYTMITLSTVGYGDIVPDTTATRLFTISLLVVGLSTFAAAIVSTVGPAISNEVARIFSPGGSRMKPTNHVILVGEGQIASNTVEELKVRGIPFCRIVESDTESSSDDCPVITGNGSEMSVLRRASIDRARMVIAARDDDGENAFIALVAKDLNPAVRVLAVASSARAMHLLKLARADLVFAPAAVGSRLLTNLIEGNEMPEEFRDLFAG
ncbi:MAG: hypothetical protein GF344_11305 [Chitinivibrionales bacterium]|nr:hypothetical protein [Chitinivibrionales bacterium]